MQLGEEEIGRLIFLSMIPPMSSPEKTKTNGPSLDPSPVVYPTPESFPILSLPHDLLMSCLARVPAMDYPSLSLASKRFPSFLTSPELREARSLLGCSQSCLYVCLRFPPHDKPRWFILSPDPNSSRYVFTPILILNSPEAPWEEQVVAVGSTIYSIGGPINDAPSSTVLVLDFGSYRWREAPSMRIKRFITTANVFDGKIYVAGGCEEDENCDDDYSNWMEVFDPKTETWESVSSPLADRCGIRIHKSAVVDGEIILSGRECVVFKPKEDKWEEIEPHHLLNLGSKLKSPCVIDNVLYRFTRLNEIIWFDSEKTYWKEVKGLESLPKRDIYSFPKLVEYGGKMVVLWEERLPSIGDDKEDKMIWCAVIALERIALERPNNVIQQIWGKVEWLDGVLKVPASCGFFCAVAATV